MTTTPPDSTTPTSTAPHPEIPAADLPGFQRPSPPRRDPLDPAVSTVDSPDPNPSDVDEDDELVDDKIRSPGPTTTAGSFPASSPETFVPVIATAVDAVGLGLHFRLANEKRIGPNDLWLADDVDRAMISMPLARIAARHIKLADGPANDVSDGIETAIATTGYVLKNFQRAKAAAAGGGTPDLPATPQGQTGP